MGFGYLFLGYLFFFNVAYAGFTDVIGVLLMLLGLSTLKQYARGFSSAFSAAIALLLVSFLSFVNAVLGLLSLASFPAELLAFASILSHALKCVLLWLTLSGVAQLAKETDIPVLTVRALRNRLLAPLFYLLAILTEVPTVFGSLFPYFATARLLIGLVFTFLCAKCFFECYIWICLEGDEHMETKPSRFGFINKLNALSAKMDEKVLSRKKEERTQKETIKQSKKQKTGRNNKEKHK